MKTRGVALTAFRQFVRDGAPLPAEVGSMSPPEADLLLIEALEAEARDCRQAYREFTLPGPTRLRFEQDARRLQEKANSLLAEYLGKWAAGWPIPVGFMECEGRRPGGGSGRHLRRIASRELYDRQHPPFAGICSPEVEAHERIINTCGSPTPIIVFDLYNEEVP